ncbi:MAG: phosphoribosylformylglycinamidine synthase subunit PurQ [Deltaproteobacteria bacterium]|nr:phosphoribosylformylglycinamidine synthase subunit PurQ [Deltaproteobacteria bacterium]
MTQVKETLKKKARALVLSGFGINCDLETEYALRCAGAEAERVHVNELISLCRQGPGLASYHILVLDGGFSWADDHGAGVLLGLKLRSHLGDHLEEFITAGKLIFGICNGFQALVNMGLLPGMDGDYQTRTVALTANDCGNFRNDWVCLVADPGSRCVFTRSLTRIDLPIRHAEGKFYASSETIHRLKDSGQVALRYATPDYEPAQGAFPYNPNGSLDDIAGICDETGRIFGLMPHPEAFHHLSNHPDWTRTLDRMRRSGQTPTKNLL